MLRATLVGLLAGSAAVPSVAAPGFGIAQTTFSQQVSRICAGALLFEGQHAIGTRAGALAVSRDIRQTGERRLRRVARVPRPESHGLAIRRWLEIERRLIAAYARDYLRIWDVIEEANSPGSRAQLPARLHVLVHATDGLKRQAGGYELRLAVPDCTGGGR